MTSTLVRDSIVGDNWIQQTATANPVHRKIGADGQPTGDIITGPVRLAFCESLFDPKENDAGEKKYTTDMLFTPLADFRVFYEEYYAWCSREFPQNYDAGTQQYHGLHSPFKSQDEKLRYGGFTPGCVLITSSSQYAPPIVDLRGNTILDRNRVYPGVWAILAVKPYAFGKAGKTKDGKPMKKGIGFGVQSVMIIADDTRFGGGAPDPKALFSGVNVSAPIAQPSLVGGMPAGHAPAPAAGIPGYTMPGGGVPTPNAPPANFQMPQTTYTPPINGVGYAQPQYAAQTPAPNMTTYPIETEEQRLMREMGLA